MREKRTEGKEHKKGRIRKRTGREKKKLENKTGRKNLKGVIEEEAKERKTEGENRVRR